MRCSFTLPPLSWAISAFAVLMFDAGRAGAAVVLADFSAAPLVVPNSLDGLYLNLVTGGTSTTSTPLAGWDFNPYNAGSGLSLFSPDAPSGQGILASGPTALALLGGETIGSGGFYQTGQALGSNFRVTGTSFAGLRFMNESTGMINYAWVRMNTTASAGFPLSILSYAYENTGAPILAGQVPEPAGAGLLALSGAVALGRRRRKA